MSDQDTHGGDTHGGDTHGGDTHGGDTHGGDTHGGDTHGGSHGTDAYLWDRSGPPDPDVLRLEQLLAPFGHDGRPFGGAWRGWRSRTLLSVVAAGLLLGVVLWTVFWPVDPFALIVQSTQSRLRTGDTFAPSGNEVLVLQDTRNANSVISEITLYKDSSLQVNELRAERARFHLARGRLDAFVAGTVKERFFQVGTQATNCVDLGCEYSLEVDGNGKSTVVVTMGRVAFQDPDDATREVYVPVEATCVATKQHGAGTPRHLDTPASVIALLDDYDAIRGPDHADSRLRLVQQILPALADSGEAKFSLIAWHFLQDPSIEISRTAVRWLIEHFPGAQPAGFAVVAGRPVSAVDRERWRLNLEDDWGW